MQYDISPFNALRSTAISALYQGYPFLIQILLSIMASPSDCSLMLQMFNSLSDPLRPVVFLYSASSVICLFVLHLLLDLDDNTD